MFGAKMFIFTIAKCWKLCILKYTGFFKYKLQRVMINGCSYIFKNIAFIISANMANILRFL